MISVSGRARLAWVPALWSLVLALLMLGPALAPGFVLTYDMVWVPDLSLRPDFLGLGSGLPRAVPSDAVVSVLDEVLPGVVLQKVVLVGALTGAGAGVAALCAERSVLARCFAASVAVWNPFVVDRLVIGHWPVLVGYAVLPWLVLAARRHRDTGGVPWWLLLLVPLGSLSASAGLASAVVVLVFGLRVGSGLRHALWLVGIVIAGNAPWVVAGLLHTSAALSDPAGAELFALRDTGPLPAPLAALALGGIWNAEVVPGSRDGALAVTSLVVLVALAGVGAWHLRSRWRSRDARGLVICWVVGWGLGVLTWGAPGLIAWLASEVPGGGLVRDGARLLGLCVPLIGVLLAAGVDRIGEALPDLALRRLVLGMVVLAPLALMPDAGWGASGRLQAVAYPDSHAEVRAAVGGADGGDVLLLPFSSYRAPDWNGGRKVLDPLGRQLRPDYVFNDELVVTGRTLAGEDPRAREVAAALAESTPEARASALAAIGISVVVTDHAAPGPAPDVSGVDEDFGEGPDRLSVVTLDDVRSVVTPTGWVVSMTAAWVVFLLALVAGLLGVLRGGVSGVTVSNRVS